MPRGLTEAQIERGIRSIQAQLNKAERRGEEPLPVLVSAADAPNVYFLRRPSGIIELDMQTGGGLPAGGLVYLSGPDGAGKTFLLHKYFAMHQRLYGGKASICYATSESPPDHLRMRATGVDVAVPSRNLDEMNKARKERGQPALSKEEREALQTQTGHLHCLRHDTAEQMLDALLTIIESRSFDIVALDSVSALIPEAEAGKDLDQFAQQAAAANALTRFFQHYLPMTTGFRGENETTVIFVSQVRSNRRKSEAASHIQKYMKDWAPQGAWAARHGKLIEVTVWGSSPEKEVQRTDVIGLGGSTRQEHRVAVRKTMHWQITKGKAGTHDGITGEVDYNYNAPPFTDDFRDLIIMGISKGVIIEKKGELTFYRGQKDPDAKFKAMPTVEDAIALLKGDFELELAVRREILETMGVQCLYR